MRECFRQGIAQRTLFPKGEVTVNKDTGTWQGETLQHLGQWTMPPAMYDDQCLGAPVVTATVNVQIAQAILTNQPQNAGTDPREIDTPLTDWSDAYLRVVYGSGDTDESSFDCDLDSHAIPVLGRSVDFYLIYPVNPNTIVQDVVVLIQPPIDIFISFGIGPNGSTSNRACRKTVKVGDLTANTEGDLFPIPKMATGVIYSTQAAANNDPIISEYASAVVPASRVRLEATLSRLEYRSVPVANGARGFTLTGGSETGATGAEAIFFLSPA